MNREESIGYLKEVTRSIKDYPKKGIIFRDLTTVFQDQKAMAIVTDLLSVSVGGDIHNASYDKLVAIEARGFVLAGAISGRVGGGIVMVRKKGKLPSKKLKVEYQLEYGSDALEIHEDAILPGERVIVIDDLLATGGTAEAGCKLVESLGGIVEKILFLVELPELNGRERLAGYNIEAIYAFEGV
jgi:adenine phosphoribosyltransferase